MGTAIYAQSQAAGAQDGEADGEAGGQDDDVVEAEIVDDEKPAREEGGAA